MLVGAMASGCGSGGTTTPSDAGADALGPRPASGGTVSITAGLYTLQEKTYATTTLSAAFAAARDPACTTTTSGACTTTTCPTAPAPAARSAGAITIEGLADGTATLVPSGSSYAPDTTPTQRFLGGETLRARAAGADVPAFDRSAVAPPFLTLTAPSWAPASTLVIARANDLALAWDGGSAGASTAFVRITGGSVDLVCEVGAKAGALVVPKSALATLPKDVGFRFGALTRALGVAGSDRADLEIVAIASRGGATAEGAASVE